MTTMHLRIMTYGRILLTLWSAVCLLAHPLLMVGLWSEPTCAMHGAACACPEMCRVMKQPSVEPAAPACHADQDSATEASELKKDPSATQDTTCLLSSGCRSEREQEQTIHGHPYLPAPRTAWTYAPTIQENLLGWAAHTRSGYPPALFHPPEA